MMVVRNEGRNRAVAFAALIITAVNLVAARPSSPLDPRDAMPQSSDILTVDPGGSSAFAVPLATSMMPAETATPTVESFDAFTQVVFVTETDSSYNYLPDPVPTEAAAPLMPQPAIPVLANMTLTWMPAIAAFVLIGGQHVAADGGPDLTDSGWALGAPGPALDPASSDPAANAGALSGIRFLTSANATNATSASGGGGQLGWFYNPDLSANSTINLFGHAAVSISPNQIVVTFGATRDVPGLQLSPFDASILDVKSFTYTHLRTTGQIPALRYHHASAFDHVGNKLFVFGGMTGASLMKAGLPAAVPTTIGANAGLDINMHILDLNTRAWTTITPDSRNVYNPKGIIATAADIYGNFFVICFGRDLPSNPNPTGGCSVFDTAALVFVASKVVNKPGDYNIPSLRDGARLSTDQKNGRMMLFGGWDPQTGVFFNTTYYLNTTYLPDLHWTLVETKNETYSPSSRAYPASEIVDGDMVVWGGLNFGTSINRNLFVLCSNATTPSTGKWIDSSNWVPGKAFMALNATGPNPQRDGMPPPPPGSNPTFWPKVATFSSLAAIGVVAFGAVGLFMVRKRDGKPRKIFRGRLTKRGRWAGFKVEGRRESAGAISVSSTSSQAGLIRRRVGEMSGMATDAGPPPLAMVAVRASSDRTAYSPSNLGDDGAIDYDGRPLPRHERADGDAVAITATIRGVVQKGRGDRETFGATIDVGVVERTLAPCSFRSEAAVTDERVDIKFVFPKRAATIEAGTGWGSAIAAGTAVEKIQHSELAAGRGSWCRMGGLRGLKRIPTTTSYSSRGSAPLTQVDAPPPPPTTSTQYLPSPPVQAPGTPNLTPQADDDMFEKWAWGEAAAILASGRPGTPADMCGVERRGSTLGSRSTRSGRPRGASASAASASASGGWGLPTIPWMGAGPVGESAEVEEGVDEGCDDEGFNAWAYGFASGLAAGMQAMSDSASSVSSVSGRGPPGALRGGRGGAGRSVVDKLRSIQDRKGALVFPTPPPKPTHLRARRVEENGPGLEEVLGGG
ncbi:hypothetical protein HK101_012019 [Irineochytrium annulatum]|nr:hypothetical protein HK101_012019 [Irineochytrium annulatum]